jgi:pimeloyl-ACP methyl ester carboxylesterase
MTGNATRFRDIRFSAPDGLRLRYREYGPLVPSAVPILCLAGLTRSSADFHHVALRYASDQRVVALDYRGRGESDYDPDPANYRPEVYMGDILALLAAADLTRVIVIGTSLGGLLAMSLAAYRPAVLAGVVLNDIGPEIDPAGIERIRGYVGQDVRPRNWNDAVDQVRSGFADAYPTFTPSDWEALTRRTFRVDADGSIRLDYDMSIGRGFSHAPPPGSFWPLFGGLAAIPTLVLRGALSDILSPVTVARMRAAKPDLRAVTVPDRGHVPWLDEPAAVEAIDLFVQDVSSGAGPSSTAASE